MAHHDPAPVRDDDGPLGPSTRLSECAADLLLGGACAACRAPGASVCARCLASLPLTAVRRMPSPCPPGLVPAYSSAVYDGVVRELVVAHKERAVRSLAPVLGAQLALAVSAAVRATVDLSGPAARTATLVLVPVPSRPSAVRSRGHDATARLCRRAAERLSRAGRRTRCVPLLRLRPGVADQAGLDRAERAANLGGSMAVRPRVLGALARAGPIALVVCDDVVTTGATAREAQRALEAVGLGPVAVASVAAVLRRTAASIAVLDPGGRSAAGPGRGETARGAIGESRAWSLPREVGQD